MPNGGEHHERLGACPLCGSPRIRTRRQRNRRLLWRCRSCNGVFATPKVSEYTIPPGDDGRGYVFADSIPQMERRARRRDRRGSASPRLVAVVAIVLAIGAVGFLIYMAAQGRSGSGSDQRPTPDEFAVVAVPPSPTPELATSTPAPDTPTPQTPNAPTPTGATLLAADTPTSLPTTSSPTDTPIPTSTPAPTNTPAPRPTDTPIPTNTPTPLPTSRPASTNTPTLMPTDTPVPTQTPTPRPTETPIPTSTPTPIPTNTPTPVPTSTPTPTNTPVPVVRLALDAESRVVGYWSDGTADVEVTATLRNEGTLRLDRAQDITANCIAEDDERRSCREEFSLSLPDGFAPASESFTLRLPMGITTLELRDDSELLKAIDIVVPERILGVEREVWEYYSDREERAGEGRYGVFGRGDWYSNRVEKWRNDVPVKVWATGDDTHIIALERVLSSLEPILNLDFEWVELEQDSDLKVYTGIDRSDWYEYGIQSVEDDIIHVWGFANATRRNGEAVAGRVVIWDIGLEEDSPTYVSNLEGVTLHELLHALVPIGHPDLPWGMGGISGTKSLSPMGEAIYALNSNDLIRIGMTMDEVREVVVLQDELLDYQEQVESIEPLDLLWSSLIALHDNAVSFQLSGGWSGERRQCLGSTFGTRRGPINVMFEGVGSWEEPKIIYLDFHTDRFYMIHPDLTGTEWTHWKLDRETWQMTPSESRYDDDYWWSYWLYNGKLQGAIYSAIVDSSPEDFSVETIDGNTHLRVGLDDSNVNFRSWSEDTWDKSVNLTLVIDSSQTLVGYTFELDRDTDEYEGGCIKYKEVATDMVFLDQMNLPESIREDLNELRSRDE